MRAWMKPALIGLAVACMSLGGAATASAQPAPVPALRPEGARPPSPGRNYLWEPGHWRWERGGYHWVGGRWIQRRRGWRGHYAPGHWQRRRGEWVWTRGRWD